MRKHLIAAVLSAGTASALVLALGAAASPTRPDAAAAATRVVAGGRAAAPGGTWGKAEQVPGTAALNTGGNASVGSVSCASAGSCSAGGSYRHGTAGVQVFVVDEVHGSWGKAEEVPGTAALNTGGFAQIAVSCPSAGNCSGGGSYADVPGHPRHWQAFVVDEANGTWGNAQEVPGTAALNQGGNAVVASLSCASASHCSAGGYYTHAHSNQQTFVVDKS